MPLLRVLAAVVTASALVASEPLPDPLYPEDFPDPAVVRSGPFWYAFATNGMGGNVQVIRSLDMRSWTRRPDALPNLPSWAAPGSTWAPAVLERDGRWVLFFTAQHRTSGLQCIGRAVSSSSSGSPEGPYVDPTPQPFVCQMDRGGSIDPAVFVDPAGGSAYLLFKSEGVEGREPTRLWAQRLSADGLALDATGGGPVQLAVTDQAWEEPIVEGPAMVAGGDGWYWLLYAGNRWETPSYAIGHARCASPLGPCTKWGGGPLVSSSSSSGLSLAGPGAPETVVGPEGELLSTFHAWSPGKVGYGPAGGRRTLRALPLRFEAGRMLVGAQVAPRPDGYRLVAADGGVFAFGADGFHGSTGGLRLNRPVVGGAATPSDAGYWFVASDGGVFAFGDAGFFGSTGAVRLNRPIVGMAPTPSGRGYWLVASDGGVFAFGDAAYHGSTGAVALNAPIVGVAAAPWGDGYWLAASDGGVFAFGHGARFAGSAGAVPLRSPIVSVSASPTGGGYWLTAADGGVFAFGDAGFFGSTGDRPLNSPMVAMT